MAVTHPLSTTMDDETLRRLLLKYTRGFISVSDSE
jgi:hypothetical protein